MKLESTLAICTGGRFCKNLFSNIEKLFGTLKPTTPDSNPRLFRVSFTLPFSKQALSLLSIPQTTAAPERSFSLELTLLDDAIWT